MLTSLDTRAEASAVSAPKRRKSPSKPFLAFLAIVALSGILFVLFIGVFVAPAWARRAVYESFELGRTSDDLIAAFDAEPVYVHHHGEAREIWFMYGGFSSVSADLAVERARTGYPHPHESGIPDLYDYFQFLVRTSDRRVVAKTWNGETLWVHTLTGDFPGANVRELPEKVWAELAAEAP